jgi:hypothetical protein
MMRGEIAHGPKQKWCSTVATASGAPKRVGIRSAGESQNDVVQRASDREVSDLAALALLDGTGDERRTPGQRHPDSTRPIFALDPRRPRAIL